MTLHPGQASAHLICADDEAAEQFRVGCPSSHLSHLVPYAELHHLFTRERCIDQPVVPIRSRNGSAVFDLSAAEADYPELKVAFQQQLATEHLPDNQKIAARLMSLS